MKIKMPVIKARGYFYNFNNKTRLRDINKLREWESQFDVICRFVAIQEQNLGYRMSY
jgi:hypothetical protein